MRPRRRFLALLATGATVFGGCLGDDRPGTTRTETPTDTPTVTPGTTDVDHWITLDRPDEGIESVDPDERVLVHPENLRAWLIEAASGSDAVRDVTATRFGRIGNPVLGDLSTVELHAPDLGEIDGRTYKLETRFPPPYSLPFTADPVDESKIPSDAEIVVFEDLPPSIREEIEPLLDGDEIESYEGWLEPYEVLTRSMGDSPWGEDHTTYLERDGQHYEVIRHEITPTPHAGYAIVLRATETDADPECRLSIPDLAKDERETLTDALDAFDADRERAVHVVSDLSKSLITHLETHEYLLTHAAVFELSVESAG